MTTSVVTEAETVHEFHRLKEEAEILGFELSAETTYFRLTPKTPTEPVALTKLSAVRSFLKGFEYGVRLVATHKKGGAA
jgi:hypothetical protein